jgi:beta-galactosidase
MNRRHFLGASVAGLSLLDQLLDAQPAAGSLRQVFPLNHDWGFGGKNGDTFEQVTLPHTNAVLPWHSFDETTYQYKSLYNRGFRLPPNLKGKRIFVDFEGAMTASTVSINGHKFDEYKGGYTPFSFELTPHLNWSGNNVLAVALDSTERADIPPFGGNIDYLTFGGIYREVSLRAVPDVYIENVYAQPVEVLTANRRVDVHIHLSKDGAISSPSVSIELRDGSNVISRTHQALAASQNPFIVSLTNLGNVELWNLRKPKLYDVVVRLESAGQAVDEYQTRTGFRQAEFTDKGFYLNGEHVKLRGLNRHQTFPYVGGAMPWRAQKRDAQILRAAHINLVRTSHYPQSRHFLDACDEIGLMVLEEIPGWQHIGENAWQDISVRNVGEMIRRDWNHPSIILWGVRINESQDNHDFYTRTNQVAHELDPARATGGIRYLYNSEFLEDVFTMNDFGFPLQKPNHPRYLNTEFVGHTYSTKRFDQVERVAEHTLRHARIHNQLASDDQYAGGIGWCAFDYNTHKNFGSGDHICYHGVFDIFRIPKAAAGFYKSQCEPDEEVVLEPAFDWSSGDHSGAGGPGVVPVCSNCDHLKVYYDGKLKLEVEPDREQFAHLAHPPFLLKLDDLPLDPWGDLRIDGFIKGEKVISRTLSGARTDTELLVEPDDLALVGDGMDVTRVLLRVADKFGNTQQFGSGSVALSLEGPGEIIGENPFGLAGGAGGIWIKTKLGSGTIRLTAKHQYLGQKQIAIAVSSAPLEQLSLPV